MVGEFKISITDFSKKKFWIPSKSVDSKKIPIEILKVKSYDSASQSLLPALGSALKPTD